MFWEHLSLPVPAGKEPFVCIHEPSFMFHLKGQVAGDDQSAAKQDVVLSDDKLMYA